MAKNVLVGILRYLILILSICSSVAGAFVLWIQYRTITATTLPMELDKYAMYRLFPGYHLLPLIGVITGLFYTYAFLKLKTRSKRMWWVSLASLTVIPVIHISLAIIFTASVYRGEIAEKFSWVQALTQLMIFNFQVFISTFSSFSIISVCIILLIITYSCFNEQKRPLSKTAQYILLVYFIGLIIPVIGFTLYGFYNSYNFTDDYTKIERQVDFKLYKPTYLPVGLKQRTKYFFNNARGVNVVYEFNDLRDAYLGKTLKDGTIIISQSKADRNNSLEAALQNKLSDDQPNDISLSIAKDNKGIFFINQRTNDRLIFVTDKGVRIQILGNYIDHAEYPKIAEGLR